MSDLDSNPVVQPTAGDGDIQEPSPALWNPGAAVLWSFILSPVFGAALHMLNWKALGQTEKASESKKWIIIYVAFVAIFALAQLAFPQNKALALSYFLLEVCLFALWYFLSAKYQSRYVKTAFGKSYVRKKWYKPILIEMAFFICFYVSILVGAVINALISMMFRG